MWSLLFLCWKEGEEEGKFAIHLSTHLLDKHPACPNRMTTSSYVACSLGSRWAIARHRSAAPWRKRSGSKSARNSQPSIASPS